MVRSTAERAALRAVPFEVCEPRMPLAAHALTSPAEEALSLADADGMHLAGGQLQSAWGLTGAGQTVAVIDSGIAYDHGALGGGFGTSYRVVGGWDFTEENDADPYDDAPAGFHGTHVAGIIGSHDRQYPGIAPDVDLVALRVFNDQGRSDFGWIEQALQWVQENQFTFEHPITTVNLSMGAMPQSDPSEWRTLEDELDQLAHAGIFVSVAAGNKYRRLRTIGLSYPASSPHVIPVGSVGLDGQLSEFSQRAPRMLIAPGEKITSTATDYIEDFNGITDDFYAATGTSMAAPHVAGSAVILRQAFQLAGRTDVDQASIYRTFFRTADVVHDDETGRAYRRINLAAALESILPLSLGATADAAIPMGKLSYVELDGQQVADGLWYRLSTANSGIFTVNVAADGDSPLSVRLLDAERQTVRQKRGSGNQRLDFEVESNETFFVHISGPVAPVDVTLANLVSVQDAVATIHPSENLTEIVVDRSRTTTLNRLSYQWPAAVTRVRVNTVSNPLVELRGGRAPDEVSIRTDSAIMTSPSYRIDVLSGSQFRVNGGAGRGDVVRLYGSEGDEVLIGGSAQSRWTGQGFQHVVDGFESVYSFSGGGLDRAYLYGSNQDDIFASASERSRLSSASHLNYVEGYQRVYAYAGAGGLDKAYMHGSVHVDHLLARPSHVQMSSGAQIRYAAEFDRVYAYGQSGLDRATIFDSPGDDTLIAKPDQVSLQGASFLQYMFGFESVDAYASSGGYDSATVSGYSGRDELLIGADWAALSSSTVRRRVVAFDHVHAIGHEGIDRADVAAALALFRTQTGIGFGSDDQVVWSDGFELLGERFEPQPTTRQVARAIDEILRETTGG